MEQWNSGLNIDEILKKPRELPIIPQFHYSIIPLTVEIYIFNNPWILD
jgi:hypothetical protein